MLGGAEMRRYLTLKSNNTSLSLPLPDAANPTAITVEDIDSSPGLAALSQQDTQVSAGDYRGAFVQVSEEKDALQQELDATRKRVRTVEILDELIEPYAKRSFWFMCIYCGMVALMLLMHGCANSAFKLPESVLQFLVGSTATTVIGLVGMVLTGIFVGARGRNGS